MSKIKGGTKDKARVFIAYCDDCRCKFPKQYMAHDSIWLSVAKSSSHLCLDCFSKRLGRKLCSDDFDWDIPANMENDDVRVICGFKPLTEQEKKSLRDFLSKKFQARNYGVVV